MAWICQHTSRGPHGSSGVSGNAVIQVVNSGADGDNGKSTSNGDDLGFQLKNYSISFVRMLLHEAELDYLNVSLR